MTVAKDRLQTRIGSLTLPELDCVAAALKRSQGL